MQGQSVTTSHRQVQQMPPCRTTSPPQVLLLGMTLCYGKSLWPAQVSCIPKKYNLLTAGEWVKREQKPWEQRSSPKPKTQHVVGYYGHCYLSPSQIKYKHEKLVEVEVRTQPYCSWLASHRCAYSTSQLGEHCCTTHHSSAPQREWCDAETVHAWLAQAEHHWPAYFLWAAWFLQTHSKIPPLLNDLYQHLAQHWFLLDLRLKFF